MIMNRVLAKNNAIYGRTVDAAAHVIIESTESAPGIIVGEIVNAYGRMFPALKQSCARCLPELPTAFSMGELQKVHRQFGRGTGEYEFNHFCL